METVDVGPRKWIAPSAKIPHGQTSKGSQRFRCPTCKQTFTATFDTLYYRRQVTPKQVETILQAHAEGSSLRGISRIGQQA